MEDTKFLALFPADMKAENLIEVIVDLGRPLEYRYVDKTVFVEDVVVDRHLLNYVLQGIKDNAIYIPEGIEVFGPDNRAILDGTLHRISRIVDRYRNTVGLTCRFGRSVPGSAKIFADYAEQGDNILILGPPGGGKTTKLRDIAYHLSVNKKRRVLIVDSSNEIAGDGPVPHSSVGGARRLQIPIGRTQYDVMIEAVENHMPEVIIVDEVSNRREAEACQTIAQRGVQIIATAHGQRLSDMINNPPLSRLVGGVQTVTLSDSESIKRETRKTIQEREGEAIFNCLVELDGFNRAYIHTSVEDSVDLYLLGEQVEGDLRILAPDGRVIST